MLRLLGLLFALACVPAHGQAIQQSGSVTPGHPLRVITNGVAGDGGSPTNGSLTGIGVTASGPSICANSGPLTGALNRMCIGATQTGGGVISLDNIGGGTGGFTFRLNGVDQGIVTITLPVSAGDVACFADSTGTLEDCGTTPGEIIVGTTVISGGTSGRILYDNAGILGEATTTGTLGSVVLSVSPALTGTPTAPTAAAGTDTTQIATTAFVQTQTRVRLTTATTYNVPADFATFCAATDYLSENVDGASNNVTIQIADNTYNNPICYIRSFVGIDALNIQGNCSSLTAVTLKSSSGGSIVQFQEPNTTVTTFTCIQFDPNGSVPGVGIYHGNVVTFDRTTWVASGGTGNLAIATTGGTNINFNTSVTVGDLGTSSSFAFSGDNGFLSIEPSTTVTISGTPTYTYFFSATRGGVINAGSGVTYVNGAGATGLRYALFSGGVLDIQGATGALPGNTEFNDGSATYINAAGKIIVPLPVSAVNNLPTCDGNIVGARYYVTDNNTALSFGGVISTGGSIAIPVFCNGSAWRQG